MRRFCDVTLQLLYINVSFTFFVIVTKEKNGKSDYNVNSHESYRHGNVTQTNYQLTVNDYQLINVKIYNNVKVKLTSQNCACFANLNKIQNFKQIF